MLFKRAALVSTAAAIIGSAFYMSSEDPGQAETPPLVGEVDSGGEPGLPSAGMAASVKGGGRSEASLVGPKVQSPGELFHFQVTKDWIVAHWAYVTALPGEGDLFGYRVPVVTGTRPEDIAGSLTYYFDRSETLQRIVFSGVTAEPRPLIWQLSQQYAFQQDDAAPAGSYRYRVQWSGKTHSELYVRPAPALTADPKQPRYQIELTLARPPKPILFPDKQHARGRPIKL